MKIRDEHGFKLWFLILLLVVLLIIGSFIH